MENNYKYVKELAEDLLDIALKYDELKKYILTYPGYEVYVNDGNGNKVDSKDAKMQAIYKKYSMDVNISKKLFDALDFNISITKNGKFLLEILEIIKYQMLGQEQKTVPFQIDCVLLLQKVKNNIMQNKNIYEKSSNSYPKGFMPDFKIQDQNLEASYGHKIL